MLGPNQGFMRLQLGFRVCITRCLYFRLLSTALSKKRKQTREDGWNAERVSSVRYGPYRAEIVLKVDREPMIQSCSPMPLLGGLVWEPIRPIASAELHAIVLTRLDIETNSAMKRSINHRQGNT